MKSSLEAAAQELRLLIEESPVTRGMIVRVEGSHLYLGRPLRPNDPYPDEEPDDRVRFTLLKGPSFGLGVRRHTGKWEKAPYSGTLRELVGIVCTVMQHLVADL